MRPVPPALFACRFCKECILALCENKGADAACALCRHSISAARLFAPLVVLSAEEVAAAAEAEARQAAAAKAAADAASAKEAAKEADADGDIAMDGDDDDRPASSPAASSSSSAAAAASSSSVAAAASAPAPAKKRKGPIRLKRRHNDDEDEWDVERKSEDEDEQGPDADALGASAAAAPEVDPESLEGEIEFDSKLMTLLDQLEIMKEADPTAKALVFTQFRGTMDGIQKALTDKGVKFQMLLGQTQTRTIQRRRHEGMRPFLTCVCACVCVCVCVCVFRVCQVTTPFLSVRRRWISSNRIPTPLCSCCRCAPQRRG